MRNGAGVMLQVHIVTLHARGKPWGRTLQIVALVGDAGDAGGVGRFSQARWPNGGKRISAACPSGGC